MFEGLLLTIDILGMLVLIRWSIAQDRGAQSPPSERRPASRP